MQTLTAMTGFPNGTPIDSVQCRIAKVYEYKQLPGGKYGPTTVQNASIEDVGGNKLKVKVWGHPDISRLEGQEVVIHASHNGKGLELKHETYFSKKHNKDVTDIVLDVGKSGQFQTVAVYHANAGTAPAASPVPTASTPTGSGIQTAKVEQAGPIHPATAGAATNKAVEILIAAGVAMEMANAGRLTEAIVMIGSQIAAGALQIEKGAKTPAAKQSAPKAAETAKRPVASNLPEALQDRLGEQPEEMDVPF